MVNKRSCPNHCGEYPDQPIMEFDEVHGCWVCPSCNCFAVFNTLISSYLPYTKDTPDAPY